MELRAAGIDKGAVAEIMVIADRVLAASQASLQASVLADIEALPEVDPK